MTARRPSPPPNSVRDLLDELIAAMHLVPWIDDAEARHALKRQIVERVQVDRSGLPDLIDQLSNPNPAVRREVAEMLEWLRSPHAVTPLLALLWRDRSRAVRGRVARALQNIGTPDSLAASEEYERTIRSYPELLGTTDALARRAGVMVAEFIAAAWSGLPSGLRVADEFETRPGEVLPVNLCDLLAVLGLRARESRWICRDVRCVGESAGELRAIAEGDHCVKGRTLAHIALGVNQISHGEFLAIEEHGRSWLAIRALGGRAFEVWARDSADLEPIRAGFRRVESV